MEDKQIPVTEDEVLSEDIAGYYSNKSYPDTSDKKIQTPKQPFKFSFNINDTLKEEIYEFKNTARLQGRFLFCSLCVLGAAVLICSAFLLGINLSTTRTDIELALKTLRTVSSEYTGIDAENKQLLAEVEELSREALPLSEKTQMLEDYETTKQSFEQQLDTTNAEVKIKNDELYNITEELKALRSHTGTIMLTPGTYVVGKNIPEGAYNITGNGSILGATPEKETVINAPLYPTSSSRIELKNGYTIKINCTATFSAAGISN